MKHLQFFIEINYEVDGMPRSQIEINSSYRKDLSDLIKRYDVEYSFSNLHKESVTAFVGNYGNKYTNVRAYGKKVSTKSNKERMIDLVLESITEVKQGFPSISNNDLLSNVCNRLNMRKDILIKIILKNPERFDFHKTGNSKFEKKYIEASEGGTRFSKKFEDMTREIFKHFGFQASIETMPGAHGGTYSIEIFLRNGDKSAIIDAKSTGSKFTCNHEMADKMVQYINNFKNHKVDGKK